MAKKEFGKELRRRNSATKKKPLDIAAAESVSKNEPQKVEPAPKQKVHRTSINFPYDTYDAMLEHTFRNRITMKDYLVGLIRKDLNL